MKKLIVIQRVDNLTAKLDAARKALEDARVHLESGRVWAGTKWGPPSPMRAQHALDRINAALSELKGDE